MLNSIVLIVVLSLALSRSAAFAQPPVCDDAAIMALKGKWTADSPPRSSPVTSEQYMQAARRTDAIHALLLEAYPEPVGMEEGLWERFVGGPPLDAAPGLLGYRYRGSLVPYFCAPNASPGSILGKLGAPSRPVYARDSRVSLIVNFNNFVDTPFLRQWSQTVGGLQVFSRPRHTGTWKGYDLYVDSVGDKLVLLTRQGMLPYRPVTRKQYIDHQIAMFQRLHDNSVAATERALQDPLSLRVPGYVEQLKEGLANLVMTRERMTAPYREALMTNTAEGTLDLPAIVEGQGPDIFSTEEKGGKALVTLNPDYFRKDLPAYVPQFIVVRWQLREGVAASSFRTSVEANLPVEKIQAMIDR
jgi:hypothetical protein